jgi:hypothetical protein
MPGAMVAAIGTSEAFTKWRDFAAWLGLVPRQMLTGDRTILGRISKRGNRYLRVLFVQAACDQANDLAAAWAKGQAGHDDQTFHVSFRNGMSAHGPAAAGQSLVCSYAARLLKLSLLEKPSCRILTRASA